MTRPRSSAASPLSIAAALCLGLCFSAGAASAIRLGDPNGPDQDGDGVADDIDRCVERRGPVDNLGCPDRDEDRDGIVDRLDRCPSVPGPRSAGGCPDGQQIAAIDQGGGASSPPTGAGGTGAAGRPAADEALVRLQDKRFEFANPVQFTPASDELTPEGRATVEAVSRVLLGRPELRRVIIGGHVDEPGNTAERAKALSVRRAEAVKRLLMDLGVAPERLRARGFGYAKLLDKSETPEAARRNNRIEIVVEQADLKPYRQ